MGLRPYGSVCGHVFGISGTELFIIVVFVLLIFGPDKLPQFGRTVGRMVREFQRAQETMESMIKTEMYGEKSARIEDSADPAVKARAIPADEDEDEEEEEED